MSGIRNVTTPLPRPTFANLEEDGTMILEWVDDNVRVTLYMNQNPMDAWEVIKTTDDGQESVDGFKAVTDKLVEWLHG